MGLQPDRVAYWSNILSEQRLSGVSIREFCGARKISVHSFCDWRTKLNRLQSSKPGWVTVDAVEMQLAARPASSITLRIGAAEIDVEPGFDPQHLRQLITILGAQC